MFEFLYAALLTGEPGPFFRTCHSVEFFSTGLHGKRRVERLNKLICEAQRVGIPEIVYKIDGMRSCGNLNSNF